MKTRLFILIFALVASAGTLFAESGTLGDNATVTIGGTEYWKDNAYVGTGSTYLTQSQLVYQPSH